MCGQKLVTNMAATNKMNIVQYKSHHTLNASIHYLVKCKRKETTDNVKQISWAGTEGLVQNNAARIVLQVPRRFHTKPLLHQLHWLPVQQRITYKF